MSLHYAPNANLANGAYDAPGDPGSDGFNLADVSSQAEADALPAGDSALLWTGDHVGLTASFKNLVNATANDPKVTGYFLADEARASAAPKLKAEVDYIHLHAPDKMTFLIAYNAGSDTSPKAAFGPNAVDMTGPNDFTGVDPYPVQSQFAGGMDLGIIDDRIHAWEAAGWSDSQMVPLYQAFGNYGTGDWNLPTAAQEQQIIAHWASLLPNPSFDIAYSWGQQLSDKSLSMSPDLQQAFAAHNAA